MPIVYLFLHLPQRNSIRLLLHESFCLMYAQQQNLIPFYNENWRSTLSFISFHIIPYQISINTQNQPFTLILITYYIIVGYNLFECEQFLSIFIIWISIRYNCNLFIKVCLLFFILLTICLFISIFYILFYCFYKVTVIPYAGWIIVKLERIFHIFEVNDGKIIFFGYFVINLDIVLIELWNFIIFYLVLITQMLMICLIASNFLRINLIMFIGRNKIMSTCKYNKGCNKNSTAMYTPYPFLFLISYLIEGSFDINNNI